MRPLAGTLAQRLRAARCRPDRGTRADPASSGASSAASACMRLEPGDVRLELAQHCARDRRSSPAASSASSWVVRNPSPCQRRMAAATLARHASTCCATVAEISTGSRSNSSTAAADAGCSAASLRPRRQSAGSAGSRSPRRLAPRRARGLRRLEGRVAHRLERDQPVERAEQLAHVVDGERGHGLEHALAERWPAAPRPSAGGSPPGSRSRAPRCR